MENPKVLNPPRLLFIDHKCVTQFEIHKKFVIYNEILDNLYKMILSARCSDNIILKSIAYGLENMYAYTGGIYVWLNI